MLAETVILLRPLGPWRSRRLRCETSRPVSRYLARQNSCVFHNRRAYGRARERAIVYLVGLDIL